MKNNKTRRLKAIPWDALLYECYFVYDRWISTFCVASRFGGICESYCLTPVECFVQLIRTKFTSHSAHVRAKRAEICFLASTRGRHLGNRPRDKNANSARTESRCLGDAKAARMRFDPKVSGSNPGTRYLKRDMSLLWHHFPRETGYGKL